MNEPDLPMDFAPVFDFSEQDPWPLPPGGPINWPAPAAREPQRMLALASIGAGLAGVLLGIAQS